MTEELAVLADTVVRLDRLGVPYMLTGSFALGYYAQPRMTRDLDLVIEVQQGDVARLMEAFEDGYYIAEEAVHEAVMYRGMFNVIHLATMTKVDLVVRKDELYRAVEFERRQRVLFAGIPLWIVSKEDLVLSKLDWARTSRSELQLRDVRLLLDAGCDDAYLNVWVDRLNLRDVLSAVPT